MQTLDRPAGAMPASIPTAVGGGSPARPGSPRLGPVVFVAGAASLAVEICASRLLAPYFGNSTIVWANIIGLILIYLSAGYWLGGHLADRRPQPRVLGGLILVAAVLVAVIPFVARPVLSLALHGFDSIAAGAVVGSFLAALGLFALPVTLLGMVAPYALRLSLRDVTTAGTIAGRLYAISTVGSILGTFIPALITVPLVGTQRTMIGAATLLAAAAAVALLPRATIVVPVLLALLLLIPTGVVKDTGGVVFEQESAYQYVQVQEHPDGSRTLSLNEGVTTHSVWRAGTALTGGEWDMFLVVPPLIAHPVRRVLIIGNAGGTIARSLATFYPGADLVGVELDPAVTTAAQQWMGLGQIPRLSVTTADGRAFLVTSHQQYDLIVVDAYRQPYIPFYLATTEFFSLARSHLQPGGMLALNVARIPGDDRLATAIEGTVASSYPHAWAWPALKYNELVLATDDPASRDQLVSRSRRIGGQLRSLQPLFAKEVRALTPAADPMTDDRAPVEWLTDRALVSFIAGGGSLDEQFLPTRP